MSHYFIISEFIFVSSNENKSLTRSNLLKMFAKSKDVVFANETVVLYPLTLDGKRSCVQN